MRLGDFDRHDAQLEKLVDQCARNNAPFFHYSHLRGDFPHREGSDTQAEQLFVL